MGEMTGEIQMAQITAQIGGSRWLRLADGALTGRSASRRCISVCGLAPSGAFQRRNLDLLLSLAETMSYIQKRTDGPLHGRYSGV